MIPKRIATVLINSLKGGVVPRIGLPYITVGRKAETDTLLRDIEVIREGGAAFRFIVGQYGSGKSFLIQCIRNYAMDRGFAVMDADLSPERRLWGNKNQGLATYRELVRNLSTKTRPEGGALALILDRWTSSVQNRVAQNISPDDPAFAAAVERAIHETVDSLSDLVHGFDFARLLVRYFRAEREGDGETRSAILRWFRGEYETRREAREALGINIIVSDDSWYDHIKLFASFLRQAGYSGLLVFIDELVNIWKIPHAITRQYNYEKILTMYNDTLQGRASYLGLVMGATPKCMEDTRRGIFSYEALRSRLTDGRFSRTGTRDLLAPIIRLSPLTGEEMLVLVEKLAHIHADLFGAPMRLTETDLADFIRIEFSRAGAESHITPREIIRDFIELLNLLWQHPDTPASRFLGPDSEAFADSAKACGDGDMAASPFAEFDI